MATTITKRGVGVGCLAPPLSDEQLGQYEQLAQSAPEDIREAMEHLAKMLRKFWETPRSQQPGSGVSILTKEGRKTATVVPLEAQEVQRIADVVPRQDVLELYSRRFDRLDPFREKELRDAAYHLLWYGRELRKGREPVTCDQI